MASRALKLQASKKYYPPHNMYIKSGGDKSCARCEVEILQVTVNKIEVFSSF